MATVLEREIQYQQQIEDEIRRAETEERDERIRNNFVLQKAKDLGTACRQFWESDVGRFILDKATADAQHAKDKLAEISRADYKSPWEFEAAVVELQQRAHIPALIWTWLNEAILAAQQADHIITEDEHNEY